jgi:hypothetical protein
MNIKSWDGPDVIKKPVPQCLRRISNIKLKIACSSSDSGTLLMGWLYYNVGIRYNQLSNYIWQIKCKCVHRSLINNNWPWRPWIGDHELATMNWRPWIGDHEIWRRQKLLKYMKLQMYILQKTILSGPFKILKKESNIHLLMKFDYIPNEEIQNTYDKI